MDDYLSDDEMEQDEDEDDGDNVRTSTITTNNKHDEVSKQMHFWLNRTASQPLRDEQGIEISMLAF